MGEVVDLHKKFFLSDGSIVLKKELNKIDSYLLLVIIRNMQYSEYRHLPLFLISTDKNNVVSLSNITLFPDYVQDILIKTLNSFGFTISRNLGDIIIYGYKDNGKLEEWKYKLDNL